MIFIGIDPGKSGGWAVIYGDSHHEAFPWDNAAFAESMSGMAGLGVTTCVEKVGAMPGQGVTSMFSFGKSAGFIEGVLAAFNIPYQLVPPQTWKKEFSLNHSKENSITACKRLFPDVDLHRTERCTKDHDGMAEALLMAEYARRKMNCGVAK